MAKVIDYSEYKKKKEAKKNKKKKNLRDWIPFGSKIGLREKTPPYYITARAIPKVYARYFKFRASTIGIYHILKAHAFVQGGEGEANISLAEIKSISRMGYKKIYEELGLLEKAGLLEQEKIKFKTSKGYVTSRYVWTVIEPNDQQVSGIRAKLEKREKAKSKKQAKKEINESKQVELASQNARTWISKIKAQLKGGK